MKAILVLVGICVVVGGGLYVSQFIGTMPPNKESAPITESPNNTPNAVNAQNSTSVEQNLPNHSAAPDTSHAPVMNRLPNNGMGTIHPGEITEIKNDIVSIKNPQGKVQKIRITDATKYKTIEGIESKEKLAIGVLILVQGEESTDDVIVATDIVVNPPRPGGMSNF